MDIKYRIHRLGEKRGPIEGGKDAVEANFGAKSQQPLSPWVRTLWISAVLALMVSGVACYLITHSASQSETESETENENETAMPLIATAQKWQGPQPEQIAENFLAATTQQERLRWVRQPAAVAEMMERFYRDGPGGREGRGTLEKLTEGINTEATAMQRFAVTLTDGSQRMLYVTFDEGGARVDFKCYAAYCSEPWDKLLDGTMPGAAEMRLIITPNDYYNYDFSDPAQWQCLIAIAPELEDPIYLYVRRDSPLMEEIKTYPFDAPMRFTIAMEQQGESYKRRQWQLTRLIHEGWVAP